MLGNRVTQLAAMLALLATAYGAVADTDPVGTTFTYQGQLNEAGEPVSGMVDLTFALFDQADDGAPLSVLVADDFEVGEDGRFTIDLDFGDEFDGGPRWLEIGVNSVTLSPRQPIMAAPHAMVATTAANVPTKALVGNYGGITGVGTLDSLNVSGTVGIGAPAHPSAKTSIEVPANENLTGLHVHSPSQTAANTGIVSIVEGTGAIGMQAWSASGNADGMGLSARSDGSNGTAVWGRAEHPSGTTRAIWGQVNSHNGYAGYFTGGRNHFEGNVGIGILNPSAPLHVHGSVIVGNSTNQATGENSFVSGGVNMPNFASGVDSFIGGGQNNQASGPRTFIAGGRNNEASGWYSFAAGSGAKALHNGSFVWADSDFMGEVASTEPNQFTARARGGVRFFTNFGLTSGVTLEFGGSSWSSVSDRNAKENFRPVDPVDVLMGVVMMPIETWNYKSQNDSIRHMGPMAQDFHALFGLGNDELKINTVNADGVALAAIQGLYELVQEKDAQIDDLRSQNESLEDRLGALEEVVNQRLTDQTEGAR